MAGNPLMNKLKGLLGGGTKGKPGLIGGGGGVQKKASHKWTKWPTAPTAPTAPATPATPTSFFTKQTMTIIVMILLVIFVILLVVYFKPHKMFGGAVRDTDVDKFVNIYKISVDADKDDPSGLDPGLACVYRTFKTMGCLVTGDDLTTDKDPSIRHLHFMTVLDVNKLNSYTDLVISNKTVYDAFKNDMVGQLLHVRTININSVDGDDNNVIVDDDKYYVYTTTNQTLNEFVDAINNTTTIIDPRKLRDAINTYDNDVANENNIIAQQLLDAEVARKRVADAQDAQAAKDAQDAQDVKDAPDALKVTIDYDNCVRNLFKALGIDMVALVNAIDPDDALDQETLGTGMDAFYSQLVRFDKITIFIDTNKDYLSNPQMAALDLDPDDNTVASNMKAGFMSTWTMESAFDTSITPGIFTLFATTVMRDNFIANPKAKLDE